MQNTKKFSRNLLAAILFFLVSAGFAGIAEAQQPGTTATCRAVSGTCIPGSPHPQYSSCGHDWGRLDCAESYKCCTLKTSTTSANTNANANTTGGTTSPTGGGGGAPKAGNGGGATAPNALGGGNATSTSINITNPLKFETVEEVVTSLLGTLQGIVVILALVFIVIGALLYITSAGDEGRIKTAKAAITAALIGLAIALAAPSFLKEIGGILGWGAVDSSAAAGAQTLSEIAMNVLNFLLSIIGVLAIIMLIVAGIMYLTAAGDEDRVDTGKNIVKYAIIGIIVAFASLVIVSQLAKFFAP